MKPAIVENDQSTAGRSFLIFAICAMVVAGIYGTYVLYDNHQHSVWASSYIDNKTEELNSESAHRHRVVTYGEHEDWISSAIDKGVADFPEGSLFHYKSSAEEGYAILKRGRVVWRYAVIKH
jgi:hypothetical protein